MSKALDAIKRGKIKSLDDGELMDVAAELENTTWNKDNKSAVLGWAKDVAKELKSRGFTGSKVPELPSRFESMTRAGAILQEAGKIDRAYVNKSIKNFNKGIFPYDGTEEQNVKNLIDSIAKDFDLRDKKKKENLKDHIRLSISANGVLKTDASDIVGAI